MGVKLTVPPKFGDRRTWRYWTGDPKSWQDRVIFRPKLEVGVKGGGWLTITNEGFVLAEDLFGCEWETISVTRESDGATLFPVEVARAD